MKKIRCSLDLYRAVPIHRLKCSLFEKLCEHQYFVTVCFILDKIELTFYLFTLIFLIKWVIKDVSKNYIPF